MSSTKPNSIGTPWTFTPRPSVRPFYSKTTKNAELQPANPTYLNNRAAAKIQLGDFSGALNDCRSAVTFDPSFVKAHIRASKCYLNLGQVQEAVSELQLAQHVCSQNASLKENVPAIQRDLDNSRKIEFYIDKTLEFVKENKFDEAIVHLESAFMQIDGSLKIHPGKSKYI